MRFGRYVLLDRLAVGGMGEVHLARLESRGFKKLLVIKRMLPHLCQNPEFERMFCNEAAVAARLNHANIVQVFDFGEVDGAYFLAMEHVHGVDLRSIISRAVKQGKPIGWHRAAEIARGLCRALDYLHRLKDESGKSLKLVHRDISPPNVLVSFEGEVKLTDFGLARATLLSEESSGGKLKGKFSYMSPEQVSGGKIDARSDLFSLGTVLYEALTLQKAFPLEKDFRETLDSVLTRQPVPVSILADDVPEDMERLVMKLLEKDPDRRYRSAAEVLDELDRLLSQADTPTGVTQDLAKYVRDLFPEKVQTPELEHDKTVVSTDPIKTATPSLPAGSNKESENVLTASSRPSKAKLLVWGLGIASLVGLAAALYIVLWNPASTLVVDSKPPGAQVWVDGDARGRTPVTLTNLAPATPLLVKLEKEGFRPQRRIVELKQGENKKLDFILEPETGSLVITSIPAGARVELDGNETGKQTPTEISGLALGWSYRVGLVLDGYLPFEKKVVLKDTNPRIIEARLKGLPAEIDVRSGPAGAKIILDGEDTGKSTPWVLRNMEGGRSITLRLEKPGYRPWQKTVSVRGGRTILVEARLVPTGAVLWMSWIPEYTLKIDKQDMGTTPVGELHLAPGSHLIVLERQEGKRRLEFKMRIKVPASNGRKSKSFTVHFNSRPWAYVDLDGRRLGITPLSGIRLGKGEHTINIKRKWTVPLQIKLKVLPEGQ